MYYFKYATNNNKLFAIVFYELIHKRAFVLFWKSINFCNAIFTCKKNYSKFPKHNLLFSSKWKGCYLNKLCSIYFIFIQSHFILLKWSCFFIGAFGTAILYRKKYDDSLVIVKEINMHDLTASERQLAINEVSFSSFVYLLLCIALFCLIRSYLLRERERFERMKIVWSLIVN